jgi:hypothetical protein
VTYITSLNLGLHWRVSCFENLPKTENFLSQPSVLLQVNNVHATLQSCLLTGRLRTRRAAFS